MLIRYLLALILINSYCILCEPFDQIYSNEYPTELQSDETTNNYDDRYYLNNDEIFNENEKRDVIKGPSLFTNIDASTADSDLAMENEDITGHSDLSRFYEKPHNIEDKLDDMDTWIAPNTHHVSGQLHVHKKKSFVDGSKFHDDRASKKSTFPRHRHIRYEDVPDEVIKALYNWQLDDSENAAKKSILRNNSMEASAETSKPFVTEEGLEGKAEP